MKNSKLYFSLWLILFLFLLIAIYFLILFEFIATAKIIGIITVVTLIFALRVWTSKSKKKNKRLEKTALNLNHRFWLKEHIYFYKVLNKKDQIIFEDRIGLLLSKVGLIDGEIEIPFSTYLYIMSYCTITFWKLPFWDLGSITGIQNESQTSSTYRIINIDFETIINEIIENKCHPTSNSSGSSILKFQTLLLEEYQQQHNIDHQ
jgi:hypothetical protein